MSQNNHIQDELNDLNSNLPSAKFPMSVPEGYFEGLADAVLAKIKTLGESPVAEIEGLSPLLAGLSRQMPFSVPEGYFESNVSGLSILIGEEEPSSVLSGISKKMPFDVPEGYFSNNLSDLLTITGVEESSDLLANISKEMPLEVPEGYFESLSQIVLGRIIQPKVVPISRRPWMRMAVAAAVAGIMALGGYFYLNGKDSNTDQPLAVQLKKVSTKELDEFLKTTTININSGATANNVRPKTVDVSQMLDDVSDKELDAFLNQVPTADDDLYAN